VINVDKDPNKLQRPTAAVIPVSITGHPVITKWGDNSTVAEYLSEKLWKY